MLGQRHRRWPNITTTLAQYFVFRPIPYCLYTSLLYTSFNKFIKKFIYTFCIQVYIHVFKKIKTNENKEIDKIICCRYLIIKIIKIVIYLFWISINIFRRLKLEIALAILASNK